MNCSPSLTQWTREGVTVHTDTQLQRDHGIVVAFTERTGGVSAAPYSSLNLAYHVGDEASDVDQNRTRTLRALGLDESLGHLTSAEQVHGTHPAIVSFSAIPPAVLPGSVAPATDALITAEPDVPLLLCFADCVPIILVSVSGPRVVSVVHAGWRGLVAGIIDQTVAEMARSLDVDPRHLIAYVGPHIGPESFVVSEDVASIFEMTFGKLSLVSSEPTGARVSLAAAVRESLTNLGVLSCNIALMGASTARSTDRFFSYRAEQGVTGRHGAIACIQ